MVPDEISKPKIISCINGTVEDGRDIFHEKYPGVIMNLVLKYLSFFNIQLTSKTCRLKSNGGLECRALTCRKTNKVTIVVNFCKLNQRGSVFPFYGNDDHPDHLPYYFAWLSKISDTH